MHKIYKLYKKNNDWDIIYFGEKHDCEIEYFSIINDNECYRILDEENNYIIQNFYFGVLKNNLKPTNIIENKRVKLIGDIYCYGLKKITRSEIDYDKFYDQINNSGNVDFESNLWIIENKEIRHCKFGKKLFFEIIYLSKKYGIYGDPGNMKGFSFIVFNGEIINDEPLSLNDKDANNIYDNLFVTPLL